MNKIKLAGSLQEEREKKAASEPQDRALDDGVDGLFNSRPSNSDDSINESS